MSLSLSLALVLAAVTLGIAAGWLIAAAAWLALRAGVGRSRPAHVRARLHEDRDVNHGAVRRSRPVRPDRRYQPEFVSIPRR